MSYTQQIKKLEQKMISSKSDKYKSDRSKYALVNGRLKVKIQTLKNARMEHNRKVRAKKQGFKKVKKLLKVQTMTQAIDKLETDVPKLQLSDLVIQYFKLAHPNYDLKKMKEDFINNIKDVKNSQEINQSNLNNPNSAIPIPPVRSSDDNYDNNKED